MLDGNSWRKKKKNRLNWRTGIHLVELTDLKGPEIYEENQNGSLTLQARLVMIFRLFHMYMLSSGPYFSYYSYFSLLFCVFLLFPPFFLKMPCYPYFLVHKCLKWPKIIFFFPRSLEICKNQVNLRSHDAKVYEIFLLQL